RRHADPDQVSLLAPAEPFDAEAFAVGDAEQRLGLLDRFAAALVDLDDLPADAAADLVECEHVPGPLQFLLGNFLVLACLFHFLGEAFPLEAVALILQLRDGAQAALVGLERLPYAVGRAFV